MDTVTHALVGVGLAGLALGNPELSQNTQCQQAIFLATFIGSQGPDFDILYRFKGKLSYYKNHRGLSHSIPTLLTMSLATSLILNLLFPSANLFTLAFWTLLAATLHVSMDLLTPYNTRLFEPFNSKNLSSNILLIIDPFILISLVVGIVLWAKTSINPYQIFSYSFALIAVYIATRCVIYMLVKFYLRGKVKALNLIAEKVTIMPRISPIKWDVTIETQTQIITGTISLFPFQLVPQETITKTFSLFEYELINRALTLPEIEAFVTNARHCHTKIETRSSLQMIYFIDLAHKFRNNYPYTALVIFNSNLEILHINFGYGHKKIPSHVFEEGIM